MSVAARRRAAVVVAAALVAATALTVPTATQAAPPPGAGSTKVDRTLGNGLGRLLAQSGTARQRRTGGFHLDQEKLTIRDGQGRVLVDLAPQKGADRAAFRRSAAAAGLVVTAVEPRHGILEGFVALDDVERLNALPGRGTLAQAVKPRPNVGAATSQGVALQRVNQVQKRGLDGKGVTIAALSDSYDTATETIDGAPLTIHEQQDIASGDLPGPANPTYKKPVTVLEDSSEGYDEGRAMLQIVHDIAPAANLCYATADDGEVGFADNIRKLADPAGRCGADVIVDDVGYFDEPVYADGVISDAVDDVAGAGVHYFSAAGNTTPEQSYEGRLHLVSAARARQTSNVDLSDVDPTLFAGGFADLHPGAGVDVAKTVAVGEDGGLVDLQWNDPTDYAGATLGAPYLTETGTLSGAEPEASFAFTPTPSQLGKTVVVTTDGIPSGSTDLVLDVTTPDGTELGPKDDASSPEQLGVRLTQSGTYTITVSGFAGATGDFTLNVRPVVEPSKVTTDLNLLFFDPSGGYLGAAADLNDVTGRPVELAFPAGLPEIQVVVARAGTGSTKVSRVSLQLGYDAAFADRTEPHARAISGHPTARGATAVAAFDPFRPYLPESFTSPGGRFRLQYDSAGRPLPKSEQLRRVPQIASTDGGNTTFFVDDTTLDPDAQPNFFGTSAAAPHAAGIAALAVQRAREQDRTLSPDALRRALRRSTFDHDLDPGRSKGKVAGVTLTARGTQSQETEVAPGSMVDPRFFTLRNSSGKTMRSVVLDGSTASPSASGLPGSSRSAGIVFDPRPYDPGQPRRLVGFPFTIGGTGGGLKAASVSASYADPNGTGQYGKLVLTFAKGLKRGQSLRFGIDRDLAVSYDGASYKDPPQPVPGVNEGNGADELGGAVLLPSGEKDKSGLTFTLTRRSGKSSSGQLRNKLGSGYSPVDGYGLVNAEEAVLGG